MKATRPRRASNQLDRIYTQRLLSRDACKGVTFEHWRHQDNDDQGPICSRITSYNVCYTKLLRDGVDHLLARNLLGEDLLPGLIMKCLEFADL